MPVIPHEAIGTVAAALIAGTVAWFSLIISKDAKTSEFRQDWINSLRQELADVVANANAIHGGHAAGYPSAQKLWEVVGKNYEGINNATARIRLRLNPKERWCQEVLAQVDRLERLLAPGSALDQSLLNECEKQLVADARHLLKKEWNRVRRGELVFASAKWLSALIALGAFASLLRQSGWIKI